jgi:hypothetical protein
MLILERGGDFGRRLRELNTKVGDNQASELGDHRPYTCRSLLSPRSSSEGFVRYQQVCMSGSIIDPKDKFLVSISYYVCKALGKSPLISI